MKNTELYEEIKARAMSLANHSWEYPNDEELAGAIAYFTITQMQHHFGLIGAIKTGVVDGFVGETVVTPPIRTILPNDCSSEDYIKAMFYTDESGGRY